MKIIMFFFLFCGVVSLYSQDFTGEKWTGTSVDLLGEKMTTSQVEVTIHEENGSYYADVIEVSPSAAGSRKIRYKIPLNVSVRGISYNPAPDFVEVLYDYKWILCRVQLNRLFYDDNPLATPGLTCGQNVALEYSRSGDFEYLRGSCMVDAHGHDYSRPVPVPVVKKKTIKAVKRKRSSMLP